MSASSGGRDEVQGESETRDGSDSPEIVEIGDSSAGRTNTIDLEDGCSSVRT